MVYYCFTYINHIPNCVSEIQGHLPGSCWIPIFVGHIDQINYTFVRETSQFVVDHILILVGLSMFISILWVSENMCWA